MTRETTGLTGLILFERSFQAKDTPAFSIWLITLIPSFPCFRESSRDLEMTPLSCAFCLAGAGADVNFAA
jgi:hypothetical protein